MSKERTMRATRIGEKQGKGSDSETGEREDPLCIIVDSHESDSSQHKTAANSGIPQERIKKRWLSGARKHGIRHERKVSVSAFQL
jgi:hypothetical protein